MSLRILMIGDDPEYLEPDREMLRERGLRVYTCTNATIVQEMVGEIRPDVVFINTRKHDLNSTNIYHSLLDNIHFACIPIIYTLSEDDVYLVNRKRTAAKERRYIMSDNIVDAIKLSLINTAAAPRRRVRIDNPLYHNIVFAYRA